MNQSDQISWVSIYSTHRLKDPARDTILKGASIHLAFKPNREPAHQGNNGISGALQVSKKNCQLCLINEETNSDRFGFFKKIGAKLFQAESMLVYTQLLHQHR
jgi:hypothetical protein